MNNLFLTATRRKLRFQTSKGFLTTEDLWDLSLKSLDEIAVRLDSQTQHGRKSFLENPDTKRTEADYDNLLALEILKTVITVKQDENKAKYAEAAKAAQKEFLKGLIEKKKIGAMESMSAEELQAQLDALG